MIIKAFKKNININIISLIVFIAVYSDSLFFIVSAILGFEYDGSSSSFSYFGIYNAIIFIILLITYFKNIILKKVLYVKEIIVILIPILFICLVSITILRQGYITSNLINPIIYSLLWGTSGIISGILAKKYNVLDNFYVLLDVYNFLITISIVVSIILPFLQGNHFTTIGGATHQTASYISAFAFGINTYLYIVNAEVNKLWMTKGKIIHNLRPFLIPIHIGGILLSGGRGGFVLFICYILFDIYISKRKKKYLIRLFVLLGLFLFIYFIIITKLSNNHLFIAYIRRIFSYINKDGLDLSNTSGRDIIYVNSLPYIMKHPIIGNGLYSMYYLLGIYPHNLEIELLLEGGVIYLIFWVLLIFKIFKNIKRLCIENKNNYILYVIFLFPIVSLQFSGTYTQNSIFWFILSYVTLSSNMQALNKR